MNSDPMLILTASAAALLLGFALGYLARAWVSRRRRSIRLYGSGRR